MDLVQLRSFAEVAERGTVAAAAAALHYTAPAVSQHLGKLESELDKRLFDRVGGRLTLTSAGFQLLPIALEMLDLDARGRAAVASPRTQHVVFAGFASAIATVLLPRLERLRALASIEIVEAEDADALRDLRLGAIDVVLTQEYDGAPVKRARRFTFTPVLRDRLRLVLPPHMPPSTRLERLGDMPWLLNGRATRCADATTSLLATAGLRPKIAGSISDNATLLALVAAGLGVTIVPASVLHGRRDVTVAKQDLGVGRSILAVTRTAMAPLLTPLLEQLAPEPNATNTSGAFGSHDATSSRTRSNRAATSRAKSSSPRS